MKLTERPLGFDIIYEKKTTTQEVKVDLLKWAMKIIWNLIFNFNYGSLPSSKTDVECWVCGFALGLFWVFLICGVGTPEKHQKKGRDAELSWWVHFSWLLVVFLKLFFFYEVSKSRSSRNRQNYECKGSAGSSACCDFCVPPSHFQEQIHKIWCQLCSVWIRHWGSPKDKKTH